MKKTHGEVQLVNGKRIATPEYRSWQMMKNRCLNPNARDFKHYGGRGVVIAEAWLCFENFLADMGRRPTPTHTLERRDSDKGYTPANCVWATREVQARNRAYATTRIWVLAERLGVKQSTAQHYLWALRAELRGAPTRYTVPAIAREIIGQHLKETHNG